MGESNNEKMVIAEFNRRYELNKLIEPEAFLKYHAKPTAKEEFKLALNELKARVLIILKSPVKLLFYQFIIFICSFF